MQKSYCFVSLLAGLGVGMAAALLLAPDKTRRRIRDKANRASGLFKERAETLFQNGHQEMSRTMTGLRDKAKEKIDDAADQIVVKSRDVAHNMGKKMQVAGKRLQNA